MAALGTRRVLVPKSAYIHVHRQASDPEIDAYSCLRAPRFAIRRSAVRARLAPSRESPALVGFFGFMGAPVEGNANRLNRLPVPNEQLLGGQVCSGVLAHCARSGLVSVGTLALDGTRLQADAADRQNRSYSQIAEEILAEATEADAAEDEEHGEARGDELPGDREAKRRLDAEHQAKVDEMAAWAEAKAKYTADTGYLKKAGRKSPDRSAQSKRRRQTSPTPTRDRSRPPAASSRATPPRPRRPQSK